MDIYLDHASTTKVHPLVVASINESYEKYYANPSSLHGPGYQALQRVDEARDQLLRIVKGKNHHLVFTSGGTESNNTVIMNLADLLRRRSDQWICSSIEHPSVARPYEYLKEKGAEGTFVGCNTKGQIKLDELEAAINSGTKIISLMHVNNETGIIQPLEEVKDLIKQKNPDLILHVDGVQAFGKIPVNLQELDADYYSISAHKLGGPRGVGALFARKPLKLSPLLKGGGQERNLRSGTENTPGILGLETAALLRHQKLEETHHIIWEKRRQLIQMLQEQVGEIVVIGAAEDKDQVPGILMISVQGTRSEVILRMLSDDHIYLSSGSACSSKKTSESHVLKAMKLQKKIIEGALRISYDETLTDEDMQRFVIRLDLHTKQMRKMMKR